MRSANPVVDVALWKLPDRALLAVQNNDREPAQDAAIELDLNALGLTPQLQWQEFVGVRDLWPSNDQAPPASLDYHNSTLVIAGLAPQAERLIGIRRY